MPSSSLLFSAVLFIAIYNCVGDSPYAGQRKMCEYKAIRKCNHKFKKVFQDAKRSNEKDSLYIDLDNDVYCDAIQTFMECLDYFIARCSDGEWLSAYSFVVLEHGIMDKKCGVCPGHSYDSLERALNASSKEGYVGSDDCPDCAQHVHQECVWRFLRKMRENSNMCEDIQEFITCYKEEGDPERLCAATEIIKKFSHLCKMQGERMLDEDRSHPGMMC